jgi:hypothetical protein
MDELDQLFTEYRKALPGRDPSAAFTPGVWRRIEARRSPVSVLRRMAEACVAVAALVTLLIGTFLIPRLQKAPIYSATYVDVLAAEHNNDTLEAAENLHTELPIEAPPR